MVSHGISSTVTENIKAPWNVQVLKNALKLWKVPPH